MLDFAKKGFYVGLGIATLTKDKIQSFAKEVAERTKMTEEEGRKFVEYLEEESQKAKESLTRNIQEIVDATLGKLPWKRKIEALENRVAALEKALGIESGAAEEAAESAEAGEPAEAAGSAENEKK